MELETGGYGHPSGTEDMCHMQMFRMRCVFDTWDVCEVMYKAHWRPGCTWEAWELRANFSSQMIKRTPASAFRIQTKSRCGSLPFLADQELAPTPYSWIVSADGAEPRVTVTSMKSLLVEHLFLAPPDCAQAMANSKECGCCMKQKGTTASVFQQEGAFLDNF